MIRLVFDIIWEIILKIIEIIIPKNMKLRIIKKIIEFWQNHWKMNIFLLIIIIISLHFIYWIFSDGDLIVNIASNTTMRFRHIPSGSFNMGGDIAEATPCQHVTIAYDFYIGKYPVTQAQWLAVMGENPSFFKFDGSENNPVENVSWDDCSSFLASINEDNSLPLESQPFRLPNEAEWEYACRANTSTIFYWGNDPGRSQIVNYEWCSTNSNSITHSVGTKQPNPWGLFDMSGNVLEWCMDYWHPNHNGAPLDGRSWKDNQGSDGQHVVRGGCFDSAPEACRSDKRTGHAQNNRDCFTGFRVVYIPPTQNN